MVKKPVTCHIFLHLSFDADLNLCDFFPSFMRWASSKTIRAHSMFRIWFYSKISNFPSLFANRLTCNGTTTTTTTKTTTTNYYNNNNNNNKNKINSFTVSLVIWIITKQNKTHLLQICNVIVGCDTINIC